jgi:hypothetical protein
MADHQPAHIFVVAELLKDGWRTRTVTGNQQTNGVLFVPT